MYSVAQHEVPASHLLQVGFGDDPSGVAMATAYAGFIPTACPTGPWWGGSYAKLFFRGLR